MELYLLVCLHIIVAAHAICIVYIYLGPSIPDYLSIGLAQTRLFNENVSLYLISNKSAYSIKAETYSRFHVSFVDMATLNVTIYQERFRKSSKLRHDRDGEYIVC